ncbi:MAG: DJ-1/PfpI family protein [Planctomycetes bacterium]|nr:DJ-1/PfpI family protein [Planctomycetota bacterium]
MVARVLVLLALGFEEVEAVTVVDVLRRAGAEVVLASLGTGPVRGAHGISVAADAELAAVDGAGFDVLVLPGGQPGTRNLAADPRVLALVRDFAARGKTVGAICAAPSVLADAGVLTGRRVTSHPSVRAALVGAEVLPDAAVVRSGSIVTSQGVGTALDFALELASLLVGPERAAELARAMVHRR